MKLGTRYEDVKALEASIPARLPAIAAALGGGFRPLPADPEWPTRAGLVNDAGASLHFSVPYNDPLKINVGGGVTHELHGFTPYGDRPGSIGVSPKKSDEVIAKDIKRRLLDATVAYGLAALARREASFAKMRELRAVAASIGNGFEFPDLVKMSDRELSEHCAKGGRVMGHARGDEAIGSPLIYLAIHDAPTVTFDRMSAVEPGVAVAMIEAGLAASAKLKAAA